MKLSHITPVILTWNESPNIGRCLDRLAWAEEIIILDSGSSDDTRKICEAFENVRFFERTFDSHSSQWNHAVSLARTEWILALDADFLVSETLTEELETLPESAEENGYLSRFRYCVDGRPLRSSLYPPKTVLFRSSACTYLQDGHTQLLSGDEPSKTLKSVIDHDDRKPLGRWLEAQKKYALLEVEKLQNSRFRDLSLPDKIRAQIWPAPPVVLFYTLFVRGTFFDGWPGIFYALQRCYAELLVSLFLLEAKLRPATKESPNPSSQANHALPPSQTSSVDRRSCPTLHD